MKKTNCLECGLKKVIGDITYCTKNGGRFEIKAGTEVLDCPVGKVDTYKIEDESDKKYGYVWGGKFHAYQDKEDDMGYNEDDTYGGRDDLNVKNVFGL